ncbi:MAG TPA: zinc ribbon domain-containing protein [Bryobacteraceae bacterium]|nr:zinc ribbon domain-containing protein [Bryobacteraceae bacterium]
MPIFEYLCEDCGTKFEKLVRNGGASELACPSCGQQHLEQQLSTFAAHANGAPKESAFPSCPGGMCQTPDLCGRN